MQYTSVKKNSCSKCEIITFLMIFLTSSMSVSGDILPSSITISLWMLCFTLLLMNNNGASIRIQPSLLGASALLIFISILSSLINGEIVSNTLKLAFSFVVATLYVTRYNNDEIKNAFVSVVVFLSVVSLPLYFISLLHPTFMSGLIVVGPKSRLIYNMLIYSHDLLSNRNGGMFWEPGAFSTFINLALLIVLLGEDNDRRRKLFRVIVLLITNILTFSTTGYIAMALLLVIYLFHTTSKIEKVATIILISVVVLVLLIVYSDEILGEGTKYTYGKINVLLEGDALSSDLQTSVSVRIYSITKPFEIFLANPLFGVGINGLQNQTLAYTKGAITCTFVNWFAIYGILFGVIMVIGYTRNVVFNDMRSNLKVLILIFIAIIIISENYASNACFVAIALMGYKQKHIRKYKLSDLRVSYEK